MNTSILPQEIQNWLTAYSEDKKVCLDDYKPLQIANILLEHNKCTKSNTFKIGDFIASHLAIKRGSFIIFKARDYDVKVYSNRDRIYYIFDISSAL